MLSVLFISLSKSVFKHSLSQKVSLLSKKLLLLLSYSFIFMVVQQWHYWKKWALTRKKNMRTGFEKLKTPHNFSLLTFRQIHIIWTQLLILRRNEADAQKYLHSTLIAYQRVERTSEEVLFAFFYCYLSLSHDDEKKTQSLPSSSHSPFFVFLLLKPFFFPFRVLARVLLPVGQY